MKFIPYHRIIDPNENSFDLLSVNKLDKEKNSNLFLRKKNFIDNFWSTSGFSPSNSNNLDLSEITENIYPNNPNSSRKNRGRKRLKTTDKAISPFTFKHINYKSKMNVNFENTKELKNSSIKDILNLKISQKLKHLITMKIK